jgi:hypothetical protein
LRKNGWVVVIRNTRNTFTSFLRDYEALVSCIAAEKRNRVNSPLPYEPLSQELIRQATELFNRSQLDGKVTLEYWTEVYAGRLLNA